MRSNFTEAAGLGQEPVSMEPYRSGAYFEMERDKVFARTWLIMGRIHPDHPRGRQCDSRVPQCLLAPR